MPVVNTLLSNLGVVHFAATFCSTRLLIVDHFVPVVTDKIGLIIAAFMATYTKINTTGFLSAETSTKRFIFIV